MGVKENHNAAAYSFNILNFVGDRAVKSCGWYPDTRIRLYNRLNAHWDNRSVHEQLIVKEKVTQLDGDLLHYSYEGFEDMKMRTERYARLGAATMSDRGRITIFLKMIINPLVKFFKTYFLQMGFTDGYFGYMISYYTAQETFLKYYWALR